MPGYRIYHGFPPHQLDLAAGIVDADLDGVPDDADRRPDSDLRPYVDTGGGPTQVRNKVDAIGVSIQDQVVKAAHFASEHTDYEKRIVALADALVGRRVITPKQAKEMKNGALHGWPPLE